MLLQTTEPCGLPAPYIFSLLSSCDLLEYDCCSLMAFVMGCWAVARWKS